MSQTANAFTACPNGRHEEGYAHDFCGYSPGMEDADKRPLIFCERCGEVRALALPPVEPSGASFVSNTPIYRTGGNQ